jgi:hypothetical protein
MTLTTRYGSTSRFGSQTINGETWFENDDVFQFTSEDEVVKDLTKRNWRYLLRNGLNATTDMYGQKGFVLEPSNGRIRRTATYTYPDGSTYVDDLLLTGEILRISPTDLGVLTPNVDLSGARNRSLAQFYSNLSQVESTFKGMVFSGELGESLRMIKRPAAALRQGIDDYLRSLRKRVPRRASRRRKRKIVADTWLEYAYGWQPLVSDVDTAIDAWYKSKYVRPLFEMVRGLGYETIQAYDFDIVDTFYFLTWRQPTIVKEILTVKHYGTYASTGDGVPNTHRTGFRPTEFIPTLWELMPYSFLVDYFTNIGAIISSWSYRHLGANWLARTDYQELFLETTGQASMYQDEDTADWKYDYEVTPGSLRASRKKFNRHAGVDIDIPSLEVSVPGLTSTKWLNMAALATSFYETRRSLNSST